MTLEEAQSVLRQVSGKTYTWLQGWGLSTIRRAVWTVRNRTSSTGADKQRADEIANILARGW